MTKVMLRALLACLLLQGAAWADIPTVRSSSSGSLASTLEPVVTLPSPIEPGDAILVATAVDADQALTWDDTTHGTWEAEVAETGNGFIGCYVHTKPADGTEDGGTLTLALAVADTVKYAVYVIRDWEGTLAGGLDSAVATPTSTLTPNPPSLNPSPWGTEDTLWIAMTCTDNNNTVAQWPAGYVDNRLQPNFGAQAVSIATATRTSTDLELEDPGTFTMTNTRASVPVTLAVRGPSAPTGGLLLRRRRVD